MASKTFLVAQREYLENVRTKTFWLGILSFPLIFVVAIGIGWVMNKTKKVQDYTVLDHTAIEIGEEIQQEARQADLQRTMAELRERLDQAKAAGQDAPPAGADELRARLDAALAELPPDSPLRSLFEILRDDPESLQQMVASVKEGRPELPPKLAAAMFRWMASLTPAQQRELQSLQSTKKYRYVSPEDLGIADLSPDEQKAKANEMVKQGRLFAYFVLAADPIASLEGLSYVSENLTDDDLRSWFARAATRVIQQKRIAQADIEPKVASWIRETVTFRESKPGEGSATEDVKDEEKANKFAPVGFVYLLWIAVFTAAQMLLTNTVEEKSNRIIEVLLSSASPGQLMSGKIWGIGATGLTIVGSWVVFALLGVWIAPKLIPNLAELNLLDIVGDPLYLTSFVAYFLTGYLLFAAMLVAIGSVCNSLKEAQNLLQPVFLLLMIPLFAMIPVVQEPNGLMARVFTYIPIYTPFAMMNRASGPPPAWEYAVTSVLILVSVWVAFKAAGKIFRIGILMTGNPPKLKEILGWLKEK
ncbi:MAG: ABC transporter permease [Planctomycetota bacterium]